MWEGNGGDRNRIFAAVAYPVEDVNRGIGFCGAGAALVDYDSIACVECPFSFEGDAGGCDGISE